MSTPTPTPTPRISSTLIWCVVIVFVVTILSVTAIAISIEDGARASTMIGLILAPLTTVLGILAVFGPAINTKRLALL